MDLTGAYYWVRIFWLILHIRYPSTYDNTPEYHLSLTNLAPGTFGVHEMYTVPYLIHYLVPSSGQEIQISEAP